MKLIKSWNYFTYSIESGTIISNTLVEKAINEFWKKRVMSLKSNHHLLVMFRVSTSNNIYITLGYLQKLNKEDKDYYINYINNILSIKTDSYQDVEIDNIVIDYGIREGVASKKAVSKTLNNQNYRHYKLPITMNPLEYGYLIHNDKNLYIMETTKGTLAKILVKKDGSENYVKMYRDGMFILDYTDKKQTESLFLRQIKNSTYIYRKVDSEYVLDLFKVPKPAKLMKAKKTDSVKDERIITMDVETLVKDGGAKSMIPYLISWYDGSKTNSYYLSDYQDHKEMIRSALLDLTRAKYHNYKVYLHNLANFDAFFLLNELAKVGKLIPLIHDGKIVSLKLIFPNSTGNKFYTLHFRDSYQILISSLKKLCTSFNVEVSKGVFPHTFVNLDNLDYEGSVPLIKYFELTPSEYLKYRKTSTINGKWNLKNEAIKYCEKDCISLHQVLCSFNDLIFNKFSINFNKYPTLPSLSNAVFLIHYLDKHEIAMISGDIYNFIRQSYTGGSTDMFIPSNHTGDKVYCYDVNSLYPSVMANCEVPVGNPTYFEGDIRKYNPDAYGFFLCEITTPDELYQPILQLHCKTEGGIRTVAPLGTFNAVIFSREMDNCIKYGYKFKILKGYVFNKAVVFNKFVDDLYGLRLNYSKNHPLNFIAKILLNSLYGRFAMSTLFKETKVFDFDSFAKFDIDSVDIHDIIKLDDHFLVKINKDDTSTMLDNASETHNVNIGIASAITAYARILMSQFKNNPNLKLYYTDTDSIYTNLNPDEINKLFPANGGIVNSTELGKLKLENVSTKAIFLAPKLYCLKTTEGELIFKIKGLSKAVNISIMDFEALLQKDSILIKNQTKRLKSLSEGTIKLLEQTYTIQQTHNKRELVYDTNNKLIDTKPYVIDSSSSDIGIPIPTIK